MTYRDPRVTCRPWITADALCCAGTQDRTDCDGDTVTPSYPWTDEQLIQAASNLLFARTCYLYPGLCEETIWPCIGCGGCGHHPCHCGSYNAIELTADYPILEVTNIAINGVTVSSDLWRLDENARIVRTDDEHWPSCNNLGLTAGPIVIGDELTVTYIAGREVPVELQMACAELVCQMKKACNGDPSCQLPDHVREVTRRGVRMERDSIFSLLAVGLTGNIIIDHALSVHGNCMRARGFDPLAYSSLCSRTVVKDKTPPGPAPNPDLDNVVFIDATDSPYEIQPTDDLILADLCSGPVQAVLPADHTEGFQFTLKDRFCCAETNSLTIVSSDGDLIDGAASIVIDTACVSVTLESDGSNWSVT